MLQRKDLRMIGWVWIKIKCKCDKIFGSEEKIKRKYFMKHGMSVGNNCAIYSDITTPESYLITIGDNVTISNDVQLLTHDNSIDRLSSDKCDIFGEILIGNNCFIGAHTIILPGVTLGERTIVGAGSVVTKSFPSEVIVAGNPAKVIGHVNEYLQKYSDIAFGEAEYVIGKKESIANNSNKILKNR